MKKQRIDQLCPSEEGRFGEWIQKWIEIGLRTGPTDRAAMEMAVRGCYRTTGLAEPRFMIWVQSPLAMVCGIAYAKQIVRAQVRAQVRDQVRDQVSAQVNAQVRAQVNAQVRDQVYDQVNAQVRDQVYDQVNAQVRDQVNAQVNAQVGDQVYDQVNAQVNAQVRDQVNAQVRDQVYDQVNAQVRDQVYDQVNAQVSDQVDAVVDLDWNLYMGGQFWVGCWWGAPSYVSFLRDVCGLQLPPNIEEAALVYQATCENGCWWWPHKDFVVLVERPTYIHRDNRGRLHSLSGAAIQWPDGWGVWAWHGTRVLRQWIEAPATVDPSLALTWENIEQRRALAEIIGWERVLDKVNAKIVDTDTPDIGTLIEADLPGSSNARFLRVRCGTGRVFVLPVPAEMKTARQANAWTYDIEPQTLQLEVRT